MKAKAFHEWLGDVLREYNQNYKDEVVAEVETPEEASYDTDKDGWVVTTPDASEFHITVIRREKTGPEADR